MFRISIQSFLIVITMAFVLAPAVSFANDVYSPGPGAVCDKVGQACFDSYGASIGITKDEFGQAAADKLQDSIEEVGDDWDPTEFTMSDGVSCNTTKKVCEDSSGNMDKKMTITLFGNTAVNNKKADDSEVKAVIEGHCKLYNKKSDNNKYKGPCKIKQKMSDTSNEFVVKLDDGETYRFTEESSGYKVETPEGMSKNMATMTDHGDKAVFKWGKWQLTAKEN
ncbi:MAG: YcgJ family protein [Thermodesulfobacteriota bacterium]